MPMPFPWAAAITGGLGFLGGLFDDSDETAANAAMYAAQMGAKKIYPEQKELASKLGPYLSENLGIGLTQQEKDLYRGEAKTSILQGAKAAKRSISDIMASQGLRGGAVADRIAKTDESTLPQFASFENMMAQLDIKKKRQSIQDIINFLALSAGEVIGGNSNNNNIPSNTVNPTGGDNFASADIFSGDIMGPIGLDAIIADMVGGVEAGGGLTSGGFEL